MPQFEVRAWDLGVFWVRDKASCLGQKYFFYAECQNLEVNLELALLAQFSPALILQFQLFLRAWHLFLRAWHLFMALGQALGQVMSKAGQSIEEL